MTHSLWVLLPTHVKASSWQCLAGKGYAEHSGWREDHRGRRGRVWVLSAILLHTRICKGASQP